MNISKWGASLAVRLPKTVTEALRLEVKDVLEIVEASGAAQEAAKAERRRRAVAELADLKWKLPEGYVFDRDKANWR
jgi:antitoxin MazE